MYGPRRHSTRNSDSLSFLYWNETRRNRESSVPHTTNGENGTANDFMEPGVEIEGLEFFAQKNASNHKTDKYELAASGTPVLRRSTSFFVDIKVAGRPVDFGKDRMKLCFEFGPHPSVPKDTKIIIDIDTQKGSVLRASPSKWDAVVHRQAGNNLILEVQISCAASVGVWRCKVVTSCAKSPGTIMTKTYAHKGPIYVLFNPFSKDDSVYMPLQSNLDEYLLSDVGKVYVGNYKQPVGRDWIFGQFEDTVLPASIYILDQSNLRPTERGNPVKVARAISALVNDIDDNGVLKGRWQPPYDDGIAPWDWSGSAKILEKYMETNGTPVKYGQCWVFSAVTVTICRALGLPCRSVTNYVSAHDTNQSLTIDKFFSEDGDELTSKDDPEYGYDSIWNFHVWNDVWMARPDLPAGFGGWQAIDSTPQEASENCYQCGPAPVEAVKRGEVGLGFDVPFIFAEVNADLCHFVEDSFSNWGFTKAKTNKYHVGKMILTKAIGNHAVGDAEDITHLYKFDEGSHEERLSVYNAVRGVDRAMKFYEYPKKEIQDVYMDLIELEKVPYGGVYKARVVIENRSGQVRTLKALVRSSSVYNTGIIGQLIKKAQGEFAMAPGQKDTLALTVYPEDYMGKLVDYCMVKIYCLIRIQETNQTWSEEDDFILEKPRLEVEPVGGKLQMGRLCRINLSFTNPLEVELTKCRVTMECAGAIREIRERVPNIAPKASFTHTILATPRKSGAGSNPVTLVATFSSEEMIDVHGSAKVQIV